MEYLQAVGGLVLLVLAGDFLVRGSVSLAKRSGVPVLIIGLTIVAFGTSAPELVVGVEAVLVGAPTLALGNVVGSNIANVLLVVGLPALVAPMTCTAPRLTKNLMIMLGATAVFIALAFTGGYSWWQGLILLALLAAFLLYSAHRARTHTDDCDPTLAELEDEAEGQGDTAAIAVLFVLGGLLGLAVGANLLVNGSVTIARALGVSEAVIGLTLVAIGTSLPELVTAVAAAVRNHCDVAVGNVIGSNIFNLLGIIGISSLFGPIPVPDVFLRVDLWVMAAASMALLPYCLYRAVIGRWTGVLMVASYAAYLIYLTHSSAAMSHMTG